MARSFYPAKPGTMKAHLGTGEPFYHRASERYYTMIQRDGHYAMSPGYDRPNHDGFQRVIAFDCMSCHNGYPELAPAADLPGSPPLYTRNIPEGIDCQRCHGPGEAHVTAARAGSADAIHSTIVNPAQLEPARQMDVCFQCHLETTSRPLPNVLHRFDRGFFSFRVPTAPLSLL
jgi:hypothetical protein